MVAGRLQEKNGFYYIVLSYTDSAGKRRQPWIGTGLPVKGNKKRAEKMLAETRKDFTIPKGQVSELSPDMAFSDYMRYWLKMMRTAVTETTYSSYCFNVEKHIIPYFEPLGVTLAGLQLRQIQSFYLHEVVLRGQAENHYADPEVHDSQGVDSGLCSHGFFNEIGRKCGKHYGIVRAIKQASTPLKKSGTKPGTKKNKKRKTTK